MHRTSTYLIGIALAVAMVGCSSVAPRVRVLGVSEASNRALSAEQSRTLNVYVQVVNPTKDELALSRLDYTLDAQSWFTTTGNVTLSRRVRADGATVLEIRVPFREPAAGVRVPYTLRGRLFAGQRSWNVNAKGVIERSRAGTASRIQFRIAAK